MRTKALVGLAVLAAGAVTCVAQQNVYSLNIVGYVNKTVEANKWYLLENPLNQTDNNVTNIIKLDQTAGSPWENSTLFTYTPGTGLQLAETFYGAGEGFAGGWFPGTTVLAPGQGFYLFPKTAGTITFVGEVKLASTNTLVKGFNMVGSPYPASMSLKALGLTGGASAEGDSIFRLTPAGSFNLLVYYFADYDGWYDTSLGDGGPKEGPALNVGEGIWYSAATNSFDWKQNFSVGP